MKKDYSFYIFVSIIIIVLIISVFEFAKKVNDLEKKITDIQSTLKYYDKEVVTKDNFGELFSDYYEEVK